MKPIPLAPSSIDRSDRIQRLLSLVSLFAAGFATLIAIYFNLTRSQRVDVPGFEQTAEQVKVQKALSAEVEVLRTQLKALQSETQKISALPTESKLGIQLSQMQSSITDFGSRLGRIEGAILANPAKALEIPLLQRDLENLRVAQQSNLQAVKDGVDRLYDINKWLLGAMAVSIITLAISNFLRPKDSSTKKETQ